LVKDPKATLEQLLSDHEQQARNVMYQLVRDFGRRFMDSHGFEIDFTDEAADMIVKEALEKNTSVRDLCAEKFKDFHFGLNLISQNKGQKKFTIEADTVNQPDKVLSEWVVKSYRDSGLEAPATSPKESEGSP